MIVIGLISGTSADGIDVAVCRITGAPPQLQVEVIHHHTYDYPAGEQKRIHAASHPSTGHVDEICRLNFDVATAFAGAANQAIRDAGLTSESVDLISSHGQTLWHMALPNGQVHSTLQVGDGGVIAEQTGITTINNLRTRDVAAGGQGAPLAGYVDWLMLRHPQRWRAVQNIGGITNVTFLPPTSDSSSRPLAFDIGPGNALIDDAVKILTDGGQTFDRDGSMGRQGRADEAWLAELLQHPYYDLQPPKTTGREVFGMAQAVELVEVGRGRGLANEDILATLTTLTARTIADAYQRFAPHPIDEMILGGGGRNNPFLVSLLAEMLDPIPVLTQEDIGHSSDHKEALLIAVIGYETWHARPGTDPAITGAAHPVILGQIIPGNNYTRLIRQTWCEK